MRSGGSYIVKKSGSKPELVERTTHHPKGDHPRDANGKRLNAPAGQDVRKVPTESPARAADDKGKSGGK